MVLREIINTEQKYINSLQTLLSVYLPALETIMAPRDIRLLFPCQLEPLITMHKDLLSRLQERVDGISRWHGIVGDVFGRLCSDKQVCDFNYSFWYLKIQEFTVIYGLIRLILANSILTTSSKHFASHYTDSKHS